mmetsp:Transcript_20085/g.30547  ORF Transcript_20085/g.30547 Transcript_20085/m.30547 type:complete len:93 (-) Transcript_20085:306-584(-)
MGTFMDQRQISLRDPEVTATFGISLTTTTGNNTHISLGTSCVIIWWSNRVFAFLLSVMESNEYNAIHFFYQKKTMMRRQFTQHDENNVHTYC